jgi:hypothetical protein
MRRAWRPLPFGYTCMATSRWWYGNPPFKVEVCEVEFSHTESSTYDQWNLTSTSWPQSQRDLKTTCARPPATPDSISLCFSQIQSACTECACAHERRGHGNGRLQRLDHSQL